MYYSVGQMKSILTDVYESCKRNGLLIRKDKADTELARSLLETASSGMERLKGWNFDFERKTKNYSFILADYYEILRMLIDACLCLNKISTSNHQCANAYLCIHQPELKPNWAVLEKMRLLRNAMNYRGEAVSQEEWFKLKPEFDRCIALFTRHISKNINKQESNSIH